MRILKVMPRAYADEGEMDALIAFYETILGAKCQLRFPVLSLGLEIASVGLPGSSIHLLAGSEEALKPFRPAQATFFVDSVPNAAEELKNLGAELIHGPLHAPGGWYLIARHPDGLLAEYIDQTG
jgi:predicted enzyme related to lactoylglutathione lyase